MQKKLGIELPVRNNRKTSAWNKGKGKTYICKNCGKTIQNNTGVYQQFCCCKCSGEYRSKEKYSVYLNNQDKFKGNEIKYGWLKPFILKEQDDKCAICGITKTWNRKELHFILGHINGDATNNIRTNLRLVYPNCDSQLDTYKARNIGKSTRKYKPYHIMQH